MNTKSEAKKETLRVREARKYRPSKSPSVCPGCHVVSNNSLTDTQRPAQDVALHSMLQLLPWRLSVARALVSLVDRDLQVKFSTLAVDPTDVPVRNWGVHKDIRRRGHKRAC
jgi:hypothetical protein